MISKATSKIKLLSLGILLSLYSANSSFAKNYYLSAQVGCSLPKEKLVSNNLHSAAVKKSLKNSQAYSLIFGKNINPNLSLELEASYAKYKFSRSFKEDTSGIYLMEIYDEDGIETGQYDEFIYPINEKYIIKSNVESISGFINANYQFQNLQYLKPYLIAGIGFSSNKTGRISYIEENPKNNYYGQARTRDNFAWQIGAGVLLPIKENININLTAKYKDLGKISSSRFATSTLPVTTSNLKLKGRLRVFDLMAGLSFNF